MNRSLAFLAVGAVFALVASSLGRAQGQPVRPLYEHYCTVVPNGLTDVANKAGNEGWELVSSSQYAGVPPGESIGLNRQLFLMCFKRPK